MNAITLLKKAGVSFAPVSRGYTTDGRLRWTCKFIRDLFRPEKKVVANITFIQTRELGKLPPNVAQVLDMVPRKDPGEYGKFLAKRKMADSRQARFEYADAKSMWNALKKVFAGYEKELASLKCPRYLSDTEEIILRNLDDGRIPLETRTHLMQHRSVPESCLMNNAIHQQKHKQPSLMEDLTGVILCIK